MKSFALAASELRHKLAAQGLTPLYPGDRPTAASALAAHTSLDRPLPPVAHIGRIVRTHDEALAWVLRWQVTGRRVHVSALRAGFLVYLRAA